MSRTVFFLAMVLLSGCAKQPEWQVLSNGGTLTRVHNKTGEVQFWGHGEWHTYAEALKLPRD